MKMKLLWCDVNLGVEISERAVEKRGVWGKFSTLALTIPV